MKNASTTVAVAGLDVGDKYSRLCVLDKRSGRKIEERRIRTTEQALREAFGRPVRLRIALEAGMHSGWIARLLSSLGHEVIIANPRRLRLVYENRQKDDRVDAEQLARLARVDPALLYPVHQRSEQAEADQALLRSRAVLVAGRTQLINHCRGVVKGLGGRLPATDARTFAAKASALVPPLLQQSLAPVIDTIAELTQRIRQLDRLLERVAAERYPETARLTQVHGVGTVTALAFVLKLHTPERFARSRQVGAYLGLVPARADSGESRPQLAITKEGDRYLRKLLVQCGHYILGPFGTDSDLRRYGERLMRRGGKAAKKRAAVAVARKLAVLMHHLWITDQTYQPLHRDRQLAA